MVIWERYVDYDKIEFTPEPRGSGQKGRTRYAAQLCAFDIETSRIPEIEQSIMYVWQFSIDNKLVIMGRSWDEYLHMLGEFRDRLHGMTLLVMVHNLSFEGQFLAGIYPFTNDEVFATESRKLLKMTMYGCIEYRCSYRLFNMTLEAVTKKYSCQYTKRSGADFDYTVYRSPSTPLTHRELLYCVYDVLGLVEAVKAQNALMGDNLFTLPFTQTGYVRREAKRAQRSAHHELVNCWPCYELFQILRAAFRGGNTHANRYYVGEIIEKVHGNDVSSEYPAQQVLEQYPRTPFVKAGVYSTNMRYASKLWHNGAALLMVVDLYDVELRCWWEGFPYISSSKAIGHPVFPREDNGRILAAKHIRLAITDLDWLIIDRQYKFSKVEVLQLWSSWYGPMYDGIVELNKKLFTDKTTLKGVVGQELYYAKSKEQLNSIYGMSCQNPLNIGIAFDHLQYNEILDADPELALQKAGRQPFIVYQLGVWTTAHARTELQRFIDRAGDRAIYCDTDSLMYVGDVSFEDFNADYRARCEEAGAGAWALDRKGRKRYMGVFESEDVEGAGCKYERFVTQGAKRYAFEKGGSGKLGITVAGVSKRLGAAELERKGGLEAFQPGLMFEDSGKLEAVYRDLPFGDYEYRGEMLRITQNVTLRPTHYFMERSNDYDSLIKYCGSKDVKEALADWKRQQIFIEKIEKRD